VIEASRYILLASWVAFFAFWFLNWHRVKRTVEQQSRWTRVTFTLPVIVGLVLLTSRGSGRVLPETEFVALLASGISIFGVATTIWARSSLADNWSADITFKEGHELVQRGPYRFVRHPIYTGILSMILAVAISFGNIRGFVGTVLAALGFWYKLSLEEALMTRHFPDSYPPYRARVKALIPWIL